MTFLRLILDHEQRFRRDRVIVSLVAMEFAIALCASTSCAGTLSDATRYADKSMAIVDVVANQGARAYQEATIAAVNLCRAEIGDTSTPESREACLRRKGFAPEQIEQVREAYEALARAYDNIATALEEIREATPALERGDAAAKGTK